MTTQIKGNATSTFGGNVDVQAMCKQFHTQEVKDAYAAFLEEQINNP